MGLDTLSNKVSPDVLVHGLGTYGRSNYREYKSTNGSLSSVELLYNHVLFLQSIDVTW